MARDTLTVQEVGAEGAQEKENITFTAMNPANDMDFPNDGHTFILIKCASGAAAETLDVISVSSPYGRTQDLTVSTNDTATSMAGPFPRHLWNQSDGTVHLDSTDSNLSVAAIRFPIGR